MSQKREKWILVYSWPSLPHLQKIRYQYLIKWHQVKKDSKRVTEIFSCYPAVWHYASIENGHLPMLLRLKVPTVFGDTLL